MTTVDQQSPDLDLMANYFVGYLFERYQGSRHVRRVAAWIGFILAGIARVSDGFERSRTRQIGFRYRGKRFKVRFKHDAGPRGGIEIVRVLPLQGLPELGVVASVSSLSGAEELYHNLKEKLDAHIDRLR
jgi:hypothetical protein